MSEGETASVAAVIRVSFAAVVAVTLLAAYEARKWFEGKEDEGRSVP